jgi:hypothetical protein
MPDNLKTLKVYKNTIILNGDSFNLFLYVFQLDNARLHKARVIANCVKDVNVLL